MSGEDPVQVWVVNPEGQFVPQGPPCGCCANCQAPEEDEDEGPEITMIFEDDPESICPACGQPIQKGELTVNLTQWGEVYENQADDYPMVGTERPVHIWCVRAVFEDDDESDK